LSGSKAGTALSQPPTSYQSRSVIPPGAALAILTDVLSC
jgi:hypothetical protein